MFNLMSNFSGAHHMSLPYFIFKKAYCIVTLSGCAKRVAS